MPVKKWNHTVESPDNQMYRFACNVLPHMNMARRCCPLQFSRGFFLCVPCGVFARCIPFCTALRHYRQYPEPSSIYSRTWCASAASVYNWEIVGNAIGNFQFTHWIALKRIEWHACRREAANYVRFEGWKIWNDGSRTPHLQVGKNSRYYTTVHCAQSIGPNITGWSETSLAER